MISRETKIGLALAVISTIVTLAACEILLRAALFSDLFGIAQLQQPWRYADSQNDDDAWKLAYEFSVANRAQRVGDIHPIFGWAPPITDDNPLGLISDSTYTVESIRNPVLFFGDSFVAGATPIPHRIPQLMDDLLPEHSVLNYGVGGYGVDQIYLRFRESHAQFEQPVILFGILTQDLDRSVLSIRTGQKPYFDYVNDELVLRNLPIKVSTKEFIAENPISINSYLARFVLLRVRDLLPGNLVNRALGYEAQERRKRVINRAVIEAAAREAKQNGLKFRVVVFYSREEFGSQTWQEQYLRSVLNELDIEYFDTKTYVSSYMQRTGETINDLYYQTNGHPNERGNGVIAQGLVEYLSRAGYL